MATYYGGETLYDVIHTVATVSTAEQTDTTIYTVPTGYYALLKFAYMERDAATYNGAGETWGSSAGFFRGVMIAVGDDSSANFTFGDFLILTLVQPAPEYGNPSGKSWSDHKQWYSPNADSTTFGSIGYNYSPYNLYLSQGDLIKIRRYDSNAGSEVVRYVLDLHLFKSP